MQVAWADGSTAEVELAFTPAQAGACLRAAGRGAALDISGELSLHSSDGRLRLSAPGGLIAPLSMPSVTMHVGFDRELRSTDAAEAGFPMVDSGLYGDLVTRLPIEIEADGSVVGYARLRGEVDNDCTDEIAMGERCYPTEYITVHEGTFSR